LLVDPRRRLVQRRRIQGQEVLAALHAPAHQPGPLQHADVLRDGIQRDREGFRDIGHPRLALSQPGQDRPARRVGQRRQCLIEHIHL
jgi:hypothetical protein